MASERRTPDRLDDSELTVQVLPSLAGGHLARVEHRPSRRFATGTHQEKDQAVRSAKRELARMLARIRRRKAKGLSDR